MAVSISKPIRIRRIPKNSPGPGFRAAAKPAATRSRTPLEHSAIARRFARPRRGRRICPHFAPIRESADSSARRTIPRERPRRCEWIRLVIAARSRQTHRSALATNPVTHDEDARHRGPKEPRPSVREGDSYFLPEFLEGILGLQFMPRSKVGRHRFPRHRFISHRLFNRPKQCFRVIDIQVIPPG